MQLNDLSASVVKFTKHLHPRLLFWLYFITIILLVTLPINSAEVKNTYILHLRGDYFLHAILFIPWAFVGFLLQKRTWLWLFSGFLFAATAEGIQYFLPYRAFNVNDVMANVIGVMAGYALLWLIRIIIKLTNAHNH